MKKIPVRQILSGLQESFTAERFTIRRVEDLVGGKDLVQDLHRHDFFFILALRKGAGKHDIDFTAYTIQDHSVFFLRPGQVHQLELKAGSTGFLVEFNTEFYHPSEKSSSQRLRKASNKNFCQLEIGRFDKLMAILSAIFLEFSNREEGYRDVIKASLEIFFIEIVRQSLHPKSESNQDNLYTQERYEEFVSLVEKYLFSFKQVVDYTNLMSLSAYQLNEITKSSIGKTASSVINEHILLEAKRNLLATPNQIKEIADLLGYEDVSYFIRFFKKHTGYSPEAFRLNFK